MIKPDPHDNIVTSKMVIARPTGPDNCAIVLSSKPKATLAKEVLDMHRFNKIILFFFFMVALVITSSTNIALAKETNLKALPKYLQDEAGSKVDDIVETDIEAPSAGIARYKFVVFVRKDGSKTESRLVAFEILKNKDALPNLVWSGKWRLLKDPHIGQIKQWSYRNKPVVMVTRSTMKDTIEVELFGFAGPEMKRLNSLKGTKVLLEGAGGDNPKLVIESKGSKEAGAKSYIWKDETLVQN